MRLRRGSGGSHIHHAPDAAGGAARLAAASRHRQARCCCSPTSPPALHPAQRRHPRPRHRRGLRALRSSPTRSSAATHFRGGHVVDAVVRGRDRRHPDGPRRRGALVSRPRLQRRPGRRRRVPAPRARRPALRRARPERAPERHHETVGRRSPSSIERAGRPLVWRFEGLRLLGRAAHARPSPPPSRQRSPRAGRDRARRRAADLPRRDAGSDPSAPAHLWTIMLGRDADHVAHLRRRVRSLGIIAR